MFLPSLALALASLAPPPPVSPPAPPAASTAAPGWLQAAIDDPARAPDKADDARRKLAAIMAFSGVQPGDTVLELSPGSGYWTRVFSRIVGAQGHVYTYWPEEMSKYSAKSMARWQELAGGQHYGNVSVLSGPAAEVAIPALADVVFTSQNYHDYHNLPMDMAAFNRRLAGLIKPGGVLVIIDHAAKAGSGASAADTLHRIEPALVKTEVTAAGLELSGSSDALRNSADHHDKGVFDKALRGHTDQFVLRFAKPAGDAADPKPQTKAGNSRR